MLEIFKTFRDFGFQVANDKFIKFYSPEPDLTIDYCKNESIVGVQADALIDGNESTAWATNQKNDPTQQYVIMEFVKRPIYIDTLYFDSLCGPPVQLFIHGSDDNESWETIGIREQPIPENSTTPIHCFKKKYYKYIKLNQTQNTYTSDENYRFHIHHIEIYGTFGDIFQITCQQKTHIPRSLLFSILITLGRQI